MATASLLIAAVAAGVLAFLLRMIGKKAWIPCLDPRAGGVRNILFRAKYASDF